MIGQPRQGWERLVDAIIGAAVALVFSQLLFAPEPPRLLRRAEAAVLSTLAASLRMIADVVERDSREDADAAVEKLRELRDELAALSAIRLASDRILRHGFAWRRRARSVDRTGARRPSGFPHRQLPHACPDRHCSRRPGRVRLAAILHQLAAAMDDLAVEHGDRVSRRSAADGAGELETWLAETDGTVRARSALVAAYASIALIVNDIVLFAGVEPGPTVDSGRHPTQPHG